LNETAAVGIRHDEGLSKIHVGGKIVPDYSMARRHVNLPMHGTTDRRSCFGPPIDTTTWTLDDLESNRDAVRYLYAQWQEELHTSKSIGM
jgi:hypothetical protein